MLDRFTEQARHLVTVALEEARMMRHGHVGTEHLLVALADEPEIGALGLDRERARAEVVRTVGMGDAPAESGGQVPFTAAAKDALEEALGEAMRLGHHQVQPGHLLLAVIKQRDGVARRLLVTAGVVPSEFREALIARLSVPQPPAPAPAPAERALLAQLNGVPVGDVGNPRTDLRLLLAILDRTGPMAAWLRERGIDEPTLRRMLEAS